MSKARGIRAGKAFVELGAEDSALQRGLNRAQARLKAFGTAVRNLGAGMAAMGGAITAPIVAAAKVFADAGDQLDKMAARTGVSVEALSELGFAAEQSGASLEALGGALFRMRRRVANAATESGPAVRALRDLGLAAGELTQLSPEDQFQKIAGALGNVQNESLAAQYAFEIFGDGAKALLPLLSAGASGIEELRHQARSLGITLSTDDATAAAELTDAMSVLRHTLRSVSLAVGGAVAPILTDLSHRLALGVRAVREFMDANRGLVTGLLKVGGVLTVAGTTLAALGVSLTVVIPALKAVGAAFAFIASPVTLVITGLGALGVALGLAALEGDSFSEKMNSLAGRVLPAVQRVVDGVSAAWEALVEFTRPVFNALTQAVTTAFETIAAVVGPSVENTQSIVTGAWSTIRETVGPVLTWLRDAVIDAFAAGAFAVQNWRRVIDLAMISAAHGVVAFAGEVQHLFTETVPAYLRFLADNWRDIFRTLLDFTASIVTNLGSNLRNFFSAVMAWLRGEGFDFQWTGLLEGFESSIQQLPEIAERALGPVEKALKNEMQRLGDELAGDFATFRRSFAGDAHRIEQAAEDAGGALKQLEVSRRQAATDFSDAAMDRIGDLGARINVLGTFNAAAISQAIGAMGAGDDEDVKELREINRNTKRLLERARDTGLVFE